jgi:hypothetical protein
MLTTPRCRRQSVEPPVARADVESVQALDELASGAQRALELPPLRETKRGGWSTVSTASSGKDCDGFWTTASGPAADSPARMRAW